jgi:hypothetical protein
MRSRPAILSIRGREGSVKDIRSQYLQDLETKKLLLFIRKEFYMQDMFISWKSLK